MYINIQCRGFPLTEALKDYVKSRVRLALERYRHNIASVSVMLADVNGPKGGEDMQCRISIKSSRLPAIVVQETAVDMYDAINMCSHRAKRSASRQLEKFKQQRKGARLRHVDG